MMSWTQRRESLQPLKFITFFDFCNLKIWTFKLFMVIKTMLSLYSRKFIFKRVLWHQESWYGFTYCMSNLEYHERLLNYFLDGWDNTIKRTEKLLQAKVLQDIYDHRKDNWKDTACQANAWICIFLLLS